MDDTAQLDLDLSALDLDDFEVAEEEFTIEPLTGGYAGWPTARTCSCVTTCGHF